MSATLTTPAEGRAAPAPRAPYDPGRVGAFVERVLGDMGGAMTCLLCALGDRLGLFRALASGGPATPAGLAERAGVHERYAREWLSALACAGYLDHDPETGRFTLPPEHVPVIGMEGGPMFVGGGMMQVPALAARFDAVEEAFRTGGGVPQAEYGDALRTAMERMSATWFDHLLAPRWIPSVPAVHDALERGALLADVGCGGGRAVVALARAYRRSRFVGYDAFGPVLERARAAAVAAGVAERVRFEERDVTAGLPERCDVVTTFDAVHDFADPPAGLRAIREALRPGGRYLMLEMAAADRLEGNAGPVGAMLYATSVFYNLPVVRAAGGEGLGTMGLPEAAVRELCAAAGFRSVRRVPLVNPFNALYEAEA